MTPNLQLSGTLRCRWIAGKRVVVIAAVVVLAGTACASDKTKSTTDVSTTATTPSTSLVDSVTSVTPGSSAEIVPPSDASSPGAVREALPSTNVAEGTYEVTEFALPFDITTVGEWQRRYARKEIMMLGRGAAKGADPETEFAVTSGLVSGDTPEDALATWCSSGAIAFGVTSPATLFGSPAVQVEGPVTDDCVWTNIDTTDNLTIVGGKTVRLIAADVGGTIVVLVADGPTDSWPSLSTEVDTMSASLTLAT